jgi:hypothetical protein
VYVHAYEYVHVDGTDQRNRITDLPDVYVHAYEYVHMDGTENGTE